MAVDDVSMNLRIIHDILKDFYSLNMVNSGEKAFECMARNTPDLILLDIHMPGMDGYEILRRIKEDVKYRDIPVIFLTGAVSSEEEVRGIECGAVDYLRKPIVPELLLSRIRLHLQLRTYQKGLEVLVAEHTEALERKSGELERLHDVTLEMLAYATDCRDHETSQHIIRTRQCVALITENIHRVGVAMPEDERCNIVKGSQLHDVGKVAIPDRVLLKPGPLDSGERAIMETHAIKGFEILDMAIKVSVGASLLAVAKEIVLYHHERWDGSGYPLGLKGGDIPISARIMAIADVYDALRSERPYKRPYPAEMAAEIMANGTQKLFDPLMVELFHMLRPRIEALYLGNMIF